MLYEVITTLRRVQRFAVPALIVVPGVLHRFGDLGWIEILDLREISVANDPRRKEFGRIGLVGERILSEDHVVT